MPNRLLLAAADRPGIKRSIIGHRATREVAYRFVAGDSIEDGIAASRDLVSSGVGAILDYLGENVSSEAQADAAMDAYLRCFDASVMAGVPAHVSVKLTQLGLDLSQQGCIERMRRICRKAEEIGTWVAIDMESHRYTTPTIEVFTALRQDHRDLVLCLQAYLRRTRADIQQLLTLEPAIRLCKGAYNEPKHIAFNKRETRSAYLEDLSVLLNSCPYTAIATHDEAIIRRVLQMSETDGIPRDRFEFQMLYGVRRKLASELVDRGYAVRVYVPFGDEWYPYLMRRLAERPANLRFFLESIVRG